MRVLYLKVGQISHIGCSLYYTKQKYFFRSFLHGGFLHGGFLLGGFLHGGFLHGGFKELIKLNFLGH